MRLLTQAHYDKYRRSVKATWSYRLYRIHALPHRKRIEDGRAGAGHTSWTNLEKDPDPEHETRGNQQRTRAPTGISGAPHGPPRDQAPVPAALTTRLRPHLESRAANQTPGTK